MHDFGILRDLAVIFAVAVVVVAGLRRLKVPAIAGYILSGVLAGPGVLKLVHDLHQVELLAEVGVVLLLFGIGLEISLDRIKRLWRAIVLGGSIQVGATGAVAFGIALSAGLTPGQAVFLGCVTAISSTAVVLRGLAQRGELDAPHGRLAVGILVFQDLCVVPMMLAIPFLSGAGEPGAAFSALGKALAILAAVLVGARLIVPRLLALVAGTRQRDLFVLGVFLACFGTAYAVTGAGLSLALGAFLGGMIVAGSEYRHQAMSDLLPLREALSSVFFVSIGMLLNLGAIGAAPGMIALLLVLIIAGKFVLVFLTAAVMRLPLRVCVLTGAALSQVGEFSFVLLRAAGGTDLVPEPLGTQLLVAIILSMAVTPVFLAAGPALAAGASRVTLLERLMKVRTPEPEAVGEALTGHVVIAGYGMAGEQVAAVLKEKGLPFLIIDINPENIHRAMQVGHTAFFGDVTSGEVLEHVAIGRARGLVLAVNDPDAAIRSIRAVREHAPHVRIIARTAYEADRVRLLGQGANKVVVAEAAAARELGEVVVEACAEARAGS
ncbi:MAG: cation:proton antiporter [Candidatus Krumholzibacteriia bacterium]